MKLAVVLATGRLDEDILKKQINQILDLTIDGVTSTTVVISVDDYSYAPSELSKFVNKDVLMSYTVIKNDKRTFACTYLDGYRVALKSGADIVVEMDAGGSHRAGEIKNIVQPILDGADCSFSSRYKQGGSISNYPLQRRLISWMGSILTGFLVKGKKPGDLTGGFEAFKSDFLKRVFEYFPDSNDWISTKTAGHLFQSEIRSYACNLGAKFKEVPITYGSEKKGKKLPFWYLQKALAGYFGLLRSNVRLRKRVVS